MLKWIGYRKRLVGIPGIPARDIPMKEIALNETEWACLLGCRAGMVEETLLKTGLYEKVEKKAKKKGGE